MIIKEAVVSEKLIIDKNYIENKEDFLSLFTYTYGVEIFSPIEEDANFYYLPANSLHKLAVESVKDYRTYSQLEKPLKFVGSLRDEQERAVSEFFQNNILQSGLLQAPPGFGKTFCACNLIARESVTTLILVHTKLLFYQWIQELKNLIPTEEIGMIGDGKYSLKPITVAIYLSANNNIEKIKNYFSLVIVDEAHRCPTETFSFTINNLNALKKIAITATPSRKDGYHVLLADYFTDKLVVAKDSRDLPIPDFHVVKTGIAFNVFNLKVDWTKQLSKLSDNEKYLNLIAQTANYLISNGRCLLVQAERVSILKKLEEMIVGSKVLIGETAQKNRDQILEDVGHNVKAILTTKIFDEGISCHRLDTIFLTCPSNNPIKLEQRIGRIVRLHKDKQHPLIVDFWFSGLIVNSQQTKRLQWYLYKGYKLVDSI